MEHIERHQLTTDRAVKTRCSNHAAVVPAFQLSSFRALALLIALCLLPALCHAAEPYFSVSTDRTFTDFRPLLGPVTITLGTTNVNPAAVGLVGPGTYLIRLRIPDDTATGDLPLQVLVDNTSTQARLVLHIE